MILGASLPLILSIASLVGAAVLAVLLAIVVWRRPGVPRASAFVVLMVAGAAWAGFYAFELAVADLAAKVAWLKLEYIGIVTVPVAWLAFALDYTGRRHWLARPWLALLGVIPLATLLLAATNEAHGLIWREITLDTTGPFPALRLARGGWYWVNVAYAYLTLGWGSALLASALLRAPRRDRRAASVLLLGVASPWLVNAVYQAGLSPIPNLDPTPLAFAIGGIIFAWGLIHSRSLDIYPGLVPIARAAVVDGMRDGVLVLDTRGHLVDLNPAGERLLGRPAAALLGQPAARVLADWPATILAQPAETEAQVALDLPDTPEPRHYDLLVSPLRRPDGRAAGRLIVARDVTERRRAERRLLLLAEAGAVLSSSLDYEATLGQAARLLVPTVADYCIVDVIDERRVIRDVTVAHADPAREDLLRQLRRRYPPDLDASFGVAEVVRGGRSLLSPDLSQHQLIAVAQDAAQEPLPSDLVPTSSMIVPLLARGQLLGTISFAATRPGRRFGPADLALAEEVARRAAVAIDNARLFAAAQAAIGLREEFLGIAAHELKTPLTTVKGYVQMAARLISRPTLDRERLAEAQAALEQQVNRMEDLVVDLLDIARLQRGELVLRVGRVDLAELARQVVARFEHAPERTPRHRLMLEVAAGPRGWWDADRLDQVLTNLVSNALKYSPNGGDVRVCAASHNGQAVLTVRDQGLGIAPEEQATLFQPFARGTAARGIQGTGLGLYIAAQIITRHGGTITVASEPGVGTTFTVRLPLMHSGSPTSP